MYDALIELKTSIDTLLDKFNTEGEFCGLEHQLVGYINGIEDDFEKFMEATI